MLSNPRSAQLSSRISTPQTKSVPNRVFGQVVRSANVVLPTPSSINLPAEMAGRRRSATMSVVGHKPQHDSQNDVMEHGSEPATSLRQNLSLRMGRAANRRIYPPGTLLAIKVLTQYEKEVLALVLRHDPSIYRTSREFFDRTSTMISYLPYRLRNPIPFSLPQDKVMHWAEKLGAARETLAKTSHLCSLHLQLNGTVTASLRNVVETHAEDFLYDIKRIIRRRNLRKLSQQTRLYVEAAENILAMTLTPHEWSHTYKRIFPRVYGSKEVACDACYMTKFSSQPDALISLRGIALVCGMARLLDDGGNERSICTVEWCDAVLKTYRGRDEERMKQASKLMADDIYRLLSDHTLPPLPETVVGQSSCSPQQLRQSPQAQSAEQELHCLAVKPERQLSTAIDEIIGLFRGDSSPCERVSGYSFVAGQQTSLNPSSTDKIRSNTSVSPTTESLLALVPPPLTVKKQSRHSDPVKSSAPPKSIAGRTNGSVSNSSIFGGPSISCPRRSCSTQSRRRGSVPAMPVDVVNDALNSYQTKIDRPSGRSSLGASTIMAELERARISYDHADAIIKHRPGPQRVATVIRSSSTSTEASEEQNHSQGIARPLSNKITTRDRHIAQAEALISENATRGEETDHSSTKEGVQGTATPPPPPPPRQRKTFAQHAGDRPSALWFDLRSTADSPTSSTLSISENSPSPRFTNTDQKMQTRKLGSIVAPLRVVSSSAEASRMSEMPSLTQSPMSRMSSQGDMTCSSDPSAVSPNTSANETKAGGPWNELHMSGGLPYRHSYAPASDDAADLTLVEPRNRRYLGMKKLGDHPWDALFHSGALPFRHSYLSADEDDSVESMRYTAEICESGGNDMRDEEAGIGG